MKKAFWIIWVVLMVVGVYWGLAQQPAPSLSTADKIALQALEQKKAESRKTYEDAQQAETAILREWQTAHPGWTVNQQTFAVEKDIPTASPEATKKFLQGDPTETKK